MSLYWQSQYHFIWRGTDCCCCRIRTITRTSAAISAVAVPKFCEFNSHSLRMHRLMQRICSCIMRESLHLQIFKNRSSAVMIVLSVWSRNTASTPSAYRVHLPLRILHWWFLSFQCTQPFLHRKEIASATGTLESPGSYHITVRIFLAVRLAAAWSTSQLPWCKVPSNVPVLLLLPGTSKSQQACTDRIWYCGKYNRDRCLCCVLHDRPMPGLPIR